jgi:hypothetical protein
MFAISREHGNHSAQHDTLCRMQGIVALSDRCVGSLGRDHTVGPLGCHPCRRKRDASARKVVASLAAGCGGTKAPKRKHCALWNCSCMHGAPGHLRHMHGCVNTVASYRHAAMQCREPPKPVRFARSLSSHASSAVSVSMMQAIWRRARTKFVTRRRGGQTRASFSHQIPRRL